ncbi:cell wall glycosyl hydrolase YteR [Biscogniauxia mediterranea]|nr:cell wall glycosyl hydrolase YteR [Biscogniauxia mediterranea]
MKSFLMLIVSVASATAATPYLSWMADSFIERGVEPTFGYTSGVLYDGIVAAYELTQNESYIEWYRDQIDAVVQDNGTIAGWQPDYYSVDDYRMGNNYLWWYERTGEAKFKGAAGVVREHLNQHPRTPTGGFWQHDTTPDQMWLDGIFMADSFYARWTKRFDGDNATAWDDVVLQYDHIDARTRNTTTGLLVHGYDESKTAVWADPVTGASPLVWDRADGWYFMALLEVIPLLPESHEGRARLVRYFTTLAAALLEAQDESGGWWLIMSAPYPGEQGNYIESSASAMFVYGFLKGIRMGLLAEDEYLDAAKKGYGLLTERFVEVNDNGTLSWEGTVLVGSLLSNATFEYYTSVPLSPNDFKGAGPFMLAAYEIETL